MQPYFLCFDICLLKIHKKANHTLKTILRTIHSTHHVHLKFYCFLSNSPPHTAKIEGEGNKIVVGTVVKSKIVEL